MLILRDPDVTSRNDSNGLVADVAGTDVMLIPLDTSWDSRCFLRVRMNPTRHVRIGADS